MSFAYLVNATDRELVAWRRAILLALKQRTPNPEHRANCMTLVHLIEAEQERRREARRSAIPTVVG